MNKVIKVELTQKEFDAIIEALEWCEWEGYPDNTGTLKRLLKMRNNND
jgi:hypothetical protein